MYHPNELDQQIENLRTLQQSYGQISTAAEAYNTGKTELAANITSKGVQASATETLPELAAKVSDIQQRTVEITAPNWYGGQIGADGSLWDLYAVLAEMKNQWLGADHYKALIVCEYYKGYDSLQLQGADAYYTCDGDFYDTSSPLHTWHDSDNGKANRWVCFLFATDGARLDITNTAISPRSMYIGGHIGTIGYFVQGRLTNFVCGIEETDVVDNLYLFGYVQPWDRNVVLRNVKNVIDTDNYKNFVTNNTGLLDITTKDSFRLYAGRILQGIICTNADYVIIRGLKTIPSFNENSGCIVKVENANAVEIPDLIAFDSVSANDGMIILNGTSKLERVNIGNYLGSAVNSYIIKGGSAGNLIDIIVGEAIANIHINEWNPNNVLADAAKKAQLIDNIKNHILARVSDATGGTQLVFTVSTNMYNAIASETITWNDQTMTLADAFLTKNWLLAGA